MYENTDDDEQRIHGKIRLSPKTGNVKSYFIVILKKVQNIGGNFYQNIAMI